MKVRFTGYDDTKEVFAPLFELSLEMGKIISSNKEGEAFLQRLDAYEKSGMSLPDTRLYAQGKYQELFKFFTEHYRTPYLFASEV